MKCQVKIALEGEGLVPFYRQYQAPDYGQALARGRAKAKALTSGTSRPFTYVLSYCAGAIDPRIMESGSREDLEARSQGDSPG